MKLLKITSGITLVLAAAGLLVAQADTALQKAIRKETVEGDLKGAIEQYKKLAQGSNRAVAAQALIHMGECYEKLGSKEAGKQYELVISKFADQKDAVAQARAHLGGAAAKTKGMVSRPVWEVTGHGTVFEAAVSPDGRFIAAMGLTDTIEGEGVRLWLHDLTTGTDRGLTNADLSLGAAFSPDGKQIAYGWHSKEGDDLRILALSGTNPVAPRVLLKNADFSVFSTPAWSPDGRSIAVSVGGKDGKTVTILASVQDGSFRVLSSSGGDHLVFSPDGKYLAFDRPADDGSSQRDVFVLATDGSREIVAAVCLTFRLNCEIDAVPEIPAVVNPSQDIAMGWSPDGKHLLFASDRGGSMGLYAQPFGDGKPQGPPVLIKADIGDGRTLGLTSSGALYYHVTSLGASSYLQTVPFDFAAGRILSPPVTVGAARQQYAWSPDGKSLAYIKPGSAAGDRAPVVTIRTMETSQSREIRSDCLFVPTAVRWAPDGRTLTSTKDPLGMSLCQIDAQTAAASKLDIAPGSGLRQQDIPAWSPDQKKLYFRSAMPGGGGPVAFIEKDLASGNQREIIRRPNLGGLNLSPDGRSIATVVRDESAKSATLLLIPLDGGEPKELLRGPSLGLGWVNLSPDGRYIALVSGNLASNTAPALLIPVSGGEPRELMRAILPLAISMGMWAPDSRSVFLKKSTIANEQTELWRVPVEGGPAVKLDVNMNLDHIMGGFSVSPDGRQVGFIRGEAASGAPKEEIWVLENFLPSIPAK